LFTVHRRGLVDNAIDTFNRGPVLPHGVVMSGRDTDWSKRVQVASIDTLLAWHVDGEYKSETTYDLIIYDEAHTAVQRIKAFVDAHDHKRKLLGLRPTTLIGLTATPMAKGLSDLYSEIVMGPTVKWLTENDYLVPLRYFQAKHLGNLSKLRVSGDAFTNKSLTDAFEGLAGNGLYEDWRSIADGRPTIGFFHRLSDAREAQAIFRNHGVRCEYVDGNTKDEERQQLFKGLDRGDYDYLCNVSIVDRGTDIPAASALQICTAVNSKSRLIQMLGRVARPAPGKTDSVVIDHGNSISRLKLFFDDEIEWELQAEKSKDVEHEARPVISCPKCGNQYRGGSCRLCGYEPTGTERRAVGLKFSGGELVEINKPAKEEPKQKKKTCEQILIESLYRGAHSGRTWKQVIGMSYGVANRQTTVFRVPKTFTVGGRTYRSLYFNHPHSNRRVVDIYDFLKVRVQE
jgi:superfamily II DNA or RNA helicase